MHTLTKETQTDFKILGSRFLAILLPAKDIRIFEQKLRELRQEYYDASHHCSAYRFLENPVKEHSSDDGEPSGTAGLPILNELRSAELLNTACIVVRYFGGTKLGKSGLIDAYGQACRDVIALAELHPIREVQRFTIQLPYDQQNMFNTILERFEGQIESSDYGAEVVHQVAISLNKAESFEQTMEESRYLGLDIIAGEKGLFIGN